MMIETEQDNQERWFVARTHYFRQELKIRDWLEGRGVETFVPVERRTSKALFGRRKGHAVETPAVPGLVFLKAEKPVACSIVSEYGMPMQYLIDSATHRMMVVPDKEMEDFRRVFDLSTDHGGLMNKPLGLGDRVRIVKGVLKDVEGQVVELKGRTYVAVGLLGTIWAKAQVPRAWLARI